MDRYLLDLRAAFRSLARSGGTSLIAVAVLAMGVGFPTTMFSIVRGGTRALPFDDPGELVVVEQTRPPPGDQARARPFDYLEWTRQETSFEGLGAFTTVGRNLSADGVDAGRFSGARVTPGTFALLRVPPELGRELLPADAAPGAPPVVILSHEVWSTNFGSDPQILGRTARLDGEPHTVIGVMPEGFAFPVRADLWQPLAFSEEESRAGGGSEITVFGRLGDGVRIERATADLNAIASRLAAEYADTHAGTTIRVFPFTELETPQTIRTALNIMVAAVSLALLIACANVANLLLARAAARTHDIALRGALGAPRRRIMAVHLLEALVLAAGGAVLGLALASVGVRFFGNATANILDAFWMRFEVDWVIALFASALGAVAAVAAGLVPALRASEMDAASALKGRAVGASGFRVGRLSRTLIGVQVAFACALLVMTALFVQSALALRNVAFPYDPQGVFTGQLGFEFGGEDPVGERRRALRPLVEAVSAAPEVEAAAVASVFPGRENGRPSFFLDGVAPAREEELLSTVVTFVTPGYLDALEAAPLRGRDLTWADDADAPPVALVNDLWVRRFSPELDPIGRRVTVDGVEAEIVGIVPHLVAADVEEQRQDALYMAYLQAPRVMNVRIMARTIGDPIAATPVIRAAVAAVDADRPLFEIGTLHEAIYAEKGVLSAFGALFLLFGLGALLMTVVGLYGVVSFAVSRRMREIGIRMAVGARARNLVPLVIGEGSGPLVIGGAVGLVLAAALSHALAASIGDPMRPPGWSLYPFVAVVIGGTTLAALLVPIRKALGVQPASALRAE